MTDLEPEPQQLDDDNANWLHSMRESDDEAPDTELAVDTDEIVTAFRQRLNEGDDEFEVIRDENGQFAEVRPDNVDQFDTETRLNHAFDLAENRQSAREMGIESGDTTGEQMEILEYQDGSRDFATPVDAYETAGTNIVDGPEEAVQNNMEGPEAIEALGGNAAQTALVSDDDGREYIVKEGIEGEHPYQSRVDAMDDAELESVAETYVASYLSGNVDLHSGNVIVDEAGEAHIVDHDAMLSEEFLETQMMIPAPIVNKMRERFDELTSERMFSDHFPEDDMSNERVAVMYDQWEEAHKEAKFA